MKIEKEYNLQELANKVKESIKLSYRLTAKTANLNLITAQQIVDVLETVASWEKNKANEMELHNKKDANGNILRSMDCHLEELEDNRNCFGYCVEDDYVCTHCADYEKCRKETNKIKSSGDKAEVNSKPERNSCFGFHVSGCGKCNLCVYEKECKEKTEIVKMMKQRVLCNAET